MHLSVIKIEDIKEADMKPADIKIAIMKRPDMRGIIGQSRYGNSSYDEINMGTDAKNRI